MAYCKKARLFFQFSAAFVIAFGLATSANATAIYDLADDYSISSNPNGVWTYGTYASLAGGGSNVRPICK